LHFTQATNCPNKATSLVLAAQPAKNYKTRLTANARLWGGLVAAQRRKDRPSAEGATTAAC